ncbi:MAG: sugar phosphate isomerase/epimerase [Verrucomicrobia bacterium]|nr:MAG: sugar phosphate isomerase/epimerase [Verrucomicrobiota bacterium]
MKRAQIAAQLYTVRDHTQTAADLAETLRRLRDIGYAAVQVSAIGPIPPAEVRRICEEAGMTICATHEDPAVIRRRPGEVVETLSTLGCRHTAYPFPRDVDFTSPADIDTLVADLDRAGAVLAAAGCVLSYHNHAIEFMRLGAGTVLEAIFTRTDPRHLQAELDTYWVQFGGGDPVDWCRRMAGRLPVIHLKDYKFTAENQPSFAELGRGNLDFGRIVAAAEAAGCEWFVVEQDTCPGDPFDSLRISFEYLIEHFVDD